MQMEDEQVMVDAKKDQKKEEKVFVQEVEKKEINKKAYVEDEDDDLYGWQQ